MKAGELNSLTINRSTENGLYLVDDENNEVLLPNRYVPENFNYGDKIEVFVYFDSEDRIVATTEYPKVMVGQFATLEVVGTTSFGAFLDWGLPKDLFIPKANQIAEMYKGEFYPVYVYLDNVSGRIVATAMLNSLVDNHNITVFPQQRVEILLTHRSELGYRVIVNDKHWGMLYDNQIFKEMKLGDRTKAWVYKITEDGRIDVALQQQGLDQVIVAAEAIVELARHHDGVLPFGDRSTPDEIRDSLGMSKKVFKRAAGYLMGQGLLEINNDSCRLIDKTE